MVQMRNIFKHGTDRKPAKTYPEKLSLLLVVGSLYRDRLGLAKTCHVNRKVSKAVGICETGLK